MPRVLEKRNYKLRFRKYRPVAGEGEAGRESNFSEQPPRYSAVARFSLPKSENEYAPQI